VTAYEALCGVSPFGGANVEALMANVLAENVRDPPDKGRVPKWMREVLRRGLARDPARRFPSMDAVLAALENDPAARWRRLGLGATVVAGIAALVVGARHTASPDAPRCSGGPQRLEGIWEAGRAPTVRKRTIHDGFLTTGRGYAEKTFAGVAGALDSYAARWTASYAEACEATHVRGEQSPEVLDLRMACLHECRRGLEALVDVFAAADAKVVDNALSAVRALPSLDRCADVPSLRAIIKLPEDARTRGRVDQLRGEVVRFTALWKAGRCAQAGAAADSLIERVREVRYAPLLAETLFTTGRTGEVCADDVHGVAREREAFDAALAGGDNELAVKAAIILSTLLADRQGQIAAGREWVRTARSLLDRLGDQPLLEGWWAQSNAIVLAREGKPDEAVATIERALALRAKVLPPDDMELIMTTNTRANMLQAAGRNTEAVGAFERARGALERVVGTDHPLTGQVLLNESEALNGSGRFAEAGRAATRGLEIAQVAEAGPTFVAFGLLQVGLSRLGEGKPEEAIEPLERALEVRAPLPEASASLAEVRFALARALWSRPSARRRARALAHLARADYATTPPATAAKPVAAIDDWLKLTASLR
jgi:tetratricopeptide (TPR) repeat protein